MAQIIRLRRGTLAELNSVTLQNGEIGIVTGSAVIGDAALKTAVVIGHSDGTNRLSIARVITGNATPNLSGVTGGAAFNNMLYHETDAKALKVLNTGGNTTLDLSANISVSEIAGNISGSATSTGSFGYLNVDGDAVIGGNLTFGDADSDSVSFSADITSNLIPNASDSYNLGSTGKRWNDLFLSGSISASGGPHSILSATTIDVDAEGALTLDGSSITIGGDSDVAVDMDASTFDVDASGALTLTSTTMAFDPSSTFDLDAAGAITIDGSSITLGGDADTAFDIDTSTLDIDASGAVTIDVAGAGISIDAAAASNLTTSAGALTLEGKTGVDIKENGTSVITIDTNQDTLFASTGGSTSDPDVEFDGYVRFDGVAEVTDTTDSTSISTGAFIVDGGVGIAKDLVVGGMVTAQEFHTEFVSASIMYMSGSNKFGDSIDDIHSVSGSIHQSGSFKLNDGNMTIADTLTATNIGAFTSTGAIDFDSQDMTNVDIDSGTVDGTTIGAASHTTIKGTTIDATTDFTIDGLVITADDITNDAALEIQTAAGDITLDPGGNNVIPGSDNADALGVSGTAWSDLFLGDEAVINFNAGDVTLTHSSNLLDIDGGNTRVDRLEIDSASDYLDVSTDLQIIAAADITLNPGGNNVKPGGDSEDDLGVDGTAWRKLFVDDIDLNGQGRIDLDADADTSVRSSVDDVIAFEAGGVEIVQITATSISGSAISTGSFSDLKAIGAGAAVAVSSASLVSFRNSANSQFGYLATGDTQATTVGVVAYNTAGTLTVSSVIDGGSF